MFTPLLVFCDPLLYCGIGAGPLECGGQSFQQGYHWRKQFLQRIERIEIYNSGDEVVVEESCELWKELDPHAEEDPSALTYMTIKFKQSGLLLRIHFFLTTSLDEQIPQSQG